MEMDGVRLGGFDWPQPKQARLFKRMIDIRMMWAEFGPIMGSCWESGEVIEAEIGGQESCL